MIRDLVKLADKLDSAGLLKEADVLDGILRKLAEASGEDYKNLLKKVCNEFNAARSKDNDGNQKIRARTGMQDGMLSIIIGGRSKPNYAVVESKTDIGEFKSSADLMSEVRSILKSIKGTSGGELASLDIISSQTMPLEEVDQDDVPPSAPEGFSAVTDQYHVWVLKSNIDNSLLHRAGKALGVI